MGSYMGYLRDERPTHRYQGSFRFLDLPIELRNTIYHFLIDSWTPSVGNRNLPQNTYFQAGIRDGTKPPHIYPPGRFEPYFRLVFRENFSVRPQPAGIALAPLPKIAQLSRNIRSEALKIIFENKLFLNLEGPEALEALNSWLTGLDQCSRDALASARSVQIYLAGICHVHHPVPQPSGLKKQTIWMWSSGVAGFQVERTRGGKRLEIRTALNLVTKSQYFVYDLFLAGIEKEADRRIQRYPNNAGDNRERRKIFDGYDLIAVATLLKEPGRSAGLFHFTAGKEEFDDKVGRGWHPQAYTNLVLAKEKL